MDVTIMPSITSLIIKLQTDFPHLRFIPGSEFRWSPEEQGVFYDPDSTDLASLLHEVSHGVLQHSAYSRDVELLSLERQAWEYAMRTLSSAYNVAITVEEIERALDTYRDWLHARSSCPQCNATGIEKKKSHYMCVACMAEWHVNDARVCALRRHTLKPHQKHAS